MTISLEAIQSAAAQLEGRIVKTPTLTLNNAKLADHLPSGARVHMKMELFQQAGSFKSRGVLLALDTLSDAEKNAGVTAVSAGNHALAVSWGAKTAGISAKVVMPKSADPIRVAGCQALGAETVLMDDVEAAFTEVQRLVDEEGRTMLHPFESPHMMMGAATCGRELAAADETLDVAIIPVGGGGLIAGMSAAIKLMHPECRIIGVEPTGADSMYQSFATGAPVKLEKVSTIVDSLGAPMALPESYAVTAQNVEKVVRMEDEAFRKGMGLLFDTLKIVAEPACAASMAALCGPLKEECAGKTVGIIACGSNIGHQKFCDLAIFAGT